MLLMPSVAHFAEQLHRHKQRNRSILLWRAEVYASLTCCSHCDLQVTGFHSTSNFTLETLDKIILHQDTCRDHDGYISSLSDHQADKLRFGIIVHNKSFKLPNLTKAPRNPTKLSVLQGLSVSDPLPDEFWHDLVTVPGEIGPTIIPSTGTFLATLRDFSWKKVQVKLVNGPPMSRDPLRNFSKGQMRQRATQVVGGQIYLLMLYSVFHHSTLVFVTWVLC